LHHLTFWIAIGICYSDVIRELPEKTLTRVFSLKKGDEKSDFQSED